MYYYNAETIDRLMDVIRVLENYDFTPEQADINPYHLYHLHAHAESFLADVAMSFPREE